MHVHVQVYVAVKYKMSQTTGKKRGRKPKAATTTAAEDPESNLSSPQKVVESVSEDGGTPKKKKKALDSRFGGMTEEQIMEMLLPDHLKPGLEIVFVSKGTHMTS